MRRLNLTRVLIATVRAGQEPKRTRLIHRPAKDVFPPAAELGPRQAGQTAAANYGRITKQGRAHARSMLVEAAWVISGVPGPLRAFFMRIRDKRGKHVAAVATARKLAVTS